MNIQSECLSYSFTNCSGGCDSFIELLRAVPQNTTILMEQLPNEEAYLFTGVGIMPDNNLQNVTAFREQHFYIDINELNDFGNITLVAHALSVCVTVSRILVYHYECPYQNIGLTHLPATQAPVSGSVSIWPKCAHNSHNIRQHSMVECSAEGKWIDENDNCECDEEFFRLDNRCILKGKVTCSPSLSGIVFCYMNSHFHTGEGSL